MGIKLRTNPQEHIVNSFAGFWLHVECLPALAAPGRDVRLLHVDIVEMQVALRCVHHAFRNNDNLQKAFTPIESKATASQMKFQWGYGRCC